MCPFDEVPFHRAGVHERAGCRSLATAPQSATTPQRNLPGSYASTRVLQSGARDCVKGVKPEFVFIQFLLQPSQHNFASRELGHDAVARQLRLGQVFRGVVACEALGNTGTGAAVEGCRTRRILRRKT